MPRFAEIAKPLSDLTRKDSEFLFGVDQQMAFNTLKNALCSEPVLRIFDPSLETELHTDASAVGYGGCLLQKYENEWYPVFYFSAKTTPAESRYSSYEQEVLAMVYLLRKLRVFLLGLVFKIVTDCKAFKLTMKKRDLCARVARWALQIEEFGCEIVRHVDALSRNPVAQLC